MGKLKGRPKGSISQATIIEFRELLGQFADGKYSFDVVCGYMRRKGWLNKNFPKFPTILIKRGGTRD